MVNFCVYMQRGMHMYASIRFLTLMVLLWITITLAPFVFSAGGETVFFRNLPETNAPRAFSSIGAGNPETGGAGAVLPHFILDGIRRARWAFSLWLGEQIDQEQERTHGFHRDPARKRRLRRVIHRLKQTSLRPREPVQFRILDTDDPETIAEASSSTIYFGKAYLKLPPSEDELMFVTAHEIAHIELSHTFLKAANETGLQFRDFLHSFKNRIATSILNLDDPDAEENFRKTMNEIERGRYSRAREREADLWGARIALSAGASPKGIKETLDRFQASRKRHRLLRGRIQPDNSLDTWTLTHPTPSARLKYLERALGLKFWEKDRLQPGKLKSHGDGLVSIKS